MQAKSKIAVVTGITSLVIAVAALTMAPVGALNNNQYHPPMPYGDSFDAKNMMTTKTETENKAWVDNGGTQNVSSGTASATRNDDVSGVATGYAANNASATTAITQSNSAAAVAPEVSAPAIDDSMDHVKLSNHVYTKLEAENKASVDNWVTQNASSGSATAGCNDNVGAVSTGDAANTLTFDTTVTQSNE